MASSFAEQIPVILYLLQRLGPATLLDVGKGMGKYGFLAHEYAGIRYDLSPDPEKTVAAQSRLTIDAVEAEPTFLWPHLAQFYRKVYVGKIEQLFEQLPRYDVVLMADVIEHLRKEDGLAVVEHFVRAGSKVIVSTPKVHFEQHLFESTFEEHLSHWTVKDFSSIPFVDYQNSGAGRVFLLSGEPLKVRGFGNGPLVRLRRVVRLVRSEFI